MSKFKVGDRVRLRDGEFAWAGVEPKEIALVTKTKNDCLDQFYVNNNNNEPCDPEYWELVESELESLIQKANEYAKVIDELRVKYFDEVEFRSYLNMNWKQLATRIPKKFEYRIKEKPKFEPFSVGNGWEVSLKDNKVVIGCQKFPVSTLKAALTNLCRENFVDDFLLARTIQARRNGVSWSGHFLSWEDAEKILTVLEKL